MRLRDGQEVEERESCDGCPQYCYDYVDSVCPFFKEVSMKTKKTMTDTERTKILAAVGKSLDTMTKALADISKEIADTEKRLDKQDAAFDRIEGKSRRKKR